MKKLYLISAVLAVFIFTFYLNSQAFADKDYYSNAIESFDQKDYEVYDGKVYHIFFHSLIINPKLAFSSAMKNGYNNWMTTRGEFKKILQKLYDNNFILININDLIEYKNGQLTLKKLVLPKGKKPLIISIDDVNYYEYMKGCGFADRLTVADGKVTTIVKTPQGEKIDWEGDVIPILDSFVEKHPDFSHKGAKGIVAVTGYQGVFGYRLKDQKEKESAIKVAQALKNTGWLIANHSYSHSVKFKNGITYADFKKDLDKWDNLIAPITGKTNIYISPFGASFSVKDPKMRYLKSKGYNIFCPVYKEMTLKCQDNILISERLNIDGLTLKKYPQRIKKYLFDPANVIDPARPQIKI
ncbi:MAG TPA: hypothetical protein VIL23_06175 [Clostridia bacterium]